MNNIVLHNLPCGCIKQFDRRVYRPLNTVSFEGPHFSLFRPCRSVAADILILQDIQHQRRSWSLIRCTATSNSTPSVTLFPAGKKQARVKIPACFLKVSVEAALSGEVSKVLDEAVGAGVTGVWLIDAGNEGVCECACKPACRFTGRSICTSNLSCVCGLPAEQK